MILIYGMSRRAFKNAYSNFPLESEIRNGNLIEQPQDMSDLNLLISYFGIVYTLITLSDYNLEV